MEIDISNASQNYGRDAEPMEQAFETALQV